MTNSLPDIKVIGNRFIVESSIAQFEAHDIDDFIVALSKSFD